ncbi:PAS domain S-box protein [Azohydromonas sp. G-1-1-14]|uniref:PAS domain S-box protein n=1 Tax=Azohydromonas caseinilytica TaxID=2728836 RepID=A0A848FGL3_9BURK|nr:PAS domain S-box protein [Azohydromonas caseinilytica]
MQLAQRNAGTLHRVLSIQTVGVLFFGLDGRVHDANAASERMTGYAVRELRSGSHWNALTPPEFWDVTAQAASELAQRGGTVPHEKQLIRKDGSRLSRHSGVAGLAAGAGPGHRRAQADDQGRQDRRRGDRYATGGRSDRMGSQRGPGPIRGNSLNPGAEPVGADSSAPALSTTSSSSITGTCWNGLRRPNSSRLSSPASRSKPRTR